MHLASLGFPAQYSADLVQVKVVFRQPQPVFRPLQTGTRAAPH